MTALDHFPHSEFRRYQKETITAIEKAFKENIKYVIVEGPCGSGKSSIAVAIGMQHTQSYLLTSQKVLQTQYIHDYGSPNFVELMGRSNYMCEQSEDATCDCGPCAGSGKCSNKEDCNYEIAKRAALNADIALMNYTYFLFATYYPKTFGKVNMMICDEAHGIDREIMSFIEIKFSQRYLSRFGIMEIPELGSTGEYHEWLRSVQIALQKKIKENEEVIEDLRVEARFNHKDKESIIDQLNKVIADNTNISSQYGKINSYFESCGQNEWVHDFKKSKDGFNDNVVFRPVTIAPYVDDLLFQYSDKCLMMSATILDKDNFCRNLGIKFEEARFIKVPSTFNPENAKITFTNTGSMSYANINDTLPMISRDIDRIMDIHKDHKGLVYTHSFKISRHIIENAPDRHKGRFVGHDGGDRMEALSYFLKHKGKDKTLISPSFSEGIDLKDDLARFIVVCKMPFGFLGDPQIKRRMEIDPKWYSWKTALTLMQVTGRGNRHEKDWCRIYILDSAFKGFIFKNKKLFPNYFLRSIHD